MKYQNSVTLLYIEKSHMCTSAMNKYILAILYLLSIQLDYHILV